MCECCDVVRSVYIFFSTNLSVSPLYSYLSYPYMSITVTPSPTAAGTAAMCASYSAGRALPDTRAAALTSAWGHCWGVGVGVVRERGY